jgi:hypothetical protein
VIGMGARIKLGSLLPAIVTRDHLFPSSTKLIDFTHPSTDCGSLPDIFNMYTQYCNNSFDIEKNWELSKRIFPERIAIQDSGLRISRPQSQAERSFTSVANFNLEISLNTGLSEIVSI